MNIEHTKHILLSPDSTSAKWISHFITQTSAKSNLSTVPKSFTWFSCLQQVKQTTNMAAPTRNAIKRRNQVFWGVTGFKYDTYDENWRILVFLGWFDVALFISRRNWREISFGADRLEPARCAMFDKVRESSVKENSTGRTCFLCRKTTFCWSINACLLIWEDTGLNGCIFKKRYISEVGKLSLREVPYANSFTWLAGLFIMNIHKLLVTWMNFSLQLHLLLSSSGFTWQCFSPWKTKLITT